MVDGHGPLVAVLLNPPATTTGTRSLNAVSRAARILGYEDILVTNLCAIATPSLNQINGLGYDAWETARTDLENAINGGASVLAAWGVGGLRGDALRWRQAQVDWMIERAEIVGLCSFWTVGGEPRHPSRWHQYVSDKHGRTRGGTLEERIAQVLVEVPARSFLTDRLATPHS